MKLKAGVAWRNIGDQAFVLDLSTGMALGLSPVASFIWERLERRTVDEIIGDLLLEYEVDEETARGDLQRLLAELAGAGVLEQKG